MAECQGYKEQSEKKTLLYYKLKEQCHIIPQQLDRGFYHCMAVKESLIPQIFSEICTHFII